MVEYSLVLQVFMRKTSSAWKHLVLVKLGKTTLFLLKMMIFSLYISNVGSSLDPKAVFDLYEICNEHTRISYL